MKVIITMLALTIGSTAFAAAETRCGWIENPTPANYDLIDKSGDWVISVQGGYQAEGDLAYPTDYANDYVATNGNYGYFCSCVSATTNAKEMKIVKILKARALPLKRCLADKNLPQVYRPRTLIHSSGKGYTECTDSSELQAGFKGRQVCINKAGDYYFLAD